MIPIRVLPKDFDSDSDVAQNIWCHVIPIPIPAFCKFNDSDSYSDSIDIYSNSDSSGIECDSNLESRVSYHVF